MIHRIQKAGLVAMAWLGSATLVLASDAGAATEEAAGSGKPNPLAWQTDTALWTAVVFLILLLILAKYAWKPIMEGLAARENRIADDIANAEKANTDAKELLAQYQAQLEAAAGNVREMLEQGRRDAAAQGQAMVDKAREETLAEKERARQEIDQATTNALTQLAENSAYLAIDLAGKIIKSKITTEEQQVLVGQAMNQFGAKKA
ncbi:MAG: F0F1 ATP synthase subunit B [Thermoguttaceae bacterium]|nr:F0F1 ATP synthase subunit B [Thermoguttaceae bacterium]